MSEQNMSEQNTMKVEAVESFVYANESALRERRAAADRENLEKAQRVARYSAGVTVENGKYRIATAADDPAKVINVVVFTSLNKTKTGYRKFRAMMGDGAALAKIEDADLRGFVNNRLAFSPTVRKAFQSHFARMGMIEPGYDPGFPASLNVGF